MKIAAEWLSARSSQTVCSMLTEAGFDAYFVGGCVRNALLSVPVSDLDIATNADPAQVMALAQATGLKVVPTGIDHGTVTIIAENVPFEVTTYRRDVETDGRRAVVAFAETIEEDARRRDFTMNALYAAPDGTVVDPLGGLPDLKARHVRFIEDPAKRIEEDYLRILRFFRFTAWYGDPALGMDADGLAACAEHAEGIETLSAERIGQEMLKLMAAPDPAPAAAAMEASGAMARIMPGATTSLLAVLVHVEDQAKLAPDPCRRLALVGGDLTRLRLSNAQSGRIDLLRSGLPAEELSYRHGEALGLDRLALDAVAENRLLDTESRALVQHAAKVVFPLKAADLMPDLHGKALGDALKAAEGRWIASGFTLTKDDLLD